MLKFIENKFSIFADIDAIKMETENAIQLGVLGKVDVNAWIDRFWKGYEKTFQTRELNINFDDFFKTYSSNYSSNVNIKEVPNFMKMITNLEKYKNQEERMYTDIINCLTKLNTTNEKEQYNAMQISNFLKQTSGIFIKSLDYEISYLNKMFDVDSRVINDINPVRKFFEM